MLKYALVLILTLVSEGLVSLVIICALFDIATSQSDQIMLYVFGGPTVIAVMGITIAMFEPWRYRVSNPLNHRHG